jgi:hypothetical protein
MPEDSPISISRGRLLAYVGRRIRYNGMEGVLEMHQYSKYLPMAAIHGIQTPIFPGEAIEVKTRNGFKKRVLELAKGNGRDDYSMFFDVDDEKLAMEPAMSVPTDTEYLSVNLPEGERPSRREGHSFTEEEMGHMAKMFSPKTLKGIFRQISEAEASFPEGYKPSPGEILERMKEEDDGPEAP